MVSNLNVVENSVKKEDVKKVKENTSVKLLTEEEYNNLSEEDKKKYLRYNPTLTDQAIQALISKANKQMEAFNKLGPAFKKMMALPQPVLGEELDKFVETLNNVLKLTDPISALANTPPVNILVRPLVQLINEIIKVFGSLFFMIFSVAKGGDIFLDSTVDTFKKVDWEGLDDMFSKKEETEIVPIKINYDTIPEEAKKQVKVMEEVVTQVDSQLKVAYETAKIYKILCETTLKQYTWQGFKDKNLESLEKLGVDFSPLDRPTEKDKEDFENSFPDPSAISKTVSSTINSVIQEKKYISVADNEKLKNEAKKKQDKEQPKKVS